MNIDSVSGKNWISKEFSSDDINYFKTNYFLDEIVAKLLSIRKIKKEEIKSFLEPSIKNILPNPFILKDMDKAVDSSIKAINNNEPYYELNKDICLFAAGGLSDTSRIRTLIGG